MKKKAYMPLRRSFLSHLRDWDGSAFPAGDPVSLYGSLSGDPGELVRISQSGIDRKYSCVRSGLRFRRGKAEDDRLVRDLRCVCPVVLLVYKGHPLYEEEIVSLDMLKEENLILMNEKFQIYHDFLRACRLNGFEPKVIAKTMDGNTLRRLCKAGLGVAVSPCFPDQELPGVRAVPLVGDYNWEIYGTWLKEQENNESIRLLDLFLEKEL